VRTRSYLQARTVVWLALLACDPGFRLTPIGWAAAPQHQWERRFEGFGVRTQSLRGLIGDWWLYPRFEVFGNDQRVTVRSARLHTKSGEYPGVIDERVREVPPGGGGFLVQWHFDEQHRALDVLGDSAAIVLDLLVGSAPRMVRLEYAKGS
jgi:hypothetical protein